MNDSPAPSLRALLLGVGAFVVVTLALTLGVGALGVDNLRALVASAGVFAPLLYVALRVVTMVIAPLNGGPLGFAAGLMFGIVPGTLYSLLGEALGGSLNFWIARRLGRPVVARLAGKDGMERVDRFYHEIGDLWTLVYARLFLFAAYDFVSYAAGLTPLKYRSYLLITLTVGLPPTAASVAVGTTLTGDLGQLGLLYAVLAALALLPLLFYRRIRAWFNKRKAASAPEPHA